jgi:leucyl aminopeptidase (aminopeptidase T)
MHFHNEEAIMKKTMLTALSFTLLLFALALPPAIADMSADKQELAANLVDKCAKVKNGDIVYISGSATDMDLLEDIAVHVRRVGGFPLVTVSSDRLIKRLYDDVPPELDSQSPRLDLELAKIVDVYISLPVTQDMKLLAHVSAERRMARSEAFAPVIEVAYARNARQVSLGNGLNPTQQRAELMDLSFDQLSEIYWAGVMTDPTVLETRAKKVESILLNGKQARITNSNGTDITFDIENRPVLCTEGHITEKDMEKGGAACMVWLPAGEVYLAPTSGTATGTVVVNRMVFDGKPIENVKLTFENGLLTDMTADSDMGILKQMYEMAGEGKDEFAFVDIGINPNVKIPEGSKMTAWMASGMVTIGFGGNEWAGGDNTCPFGVIGFLPNSTFKVDGTPVVDDGVLVAAAE